jgi:hypothetical protein
LIISKFKEEMDEGEMFSFRRSRPRAFDVFPPVLGFRRGMLHLIGCPLSLRGPSKRLFPLRGKPFGTFFGL